MWGSSHIWQGDGGVSPGCTSWKFTILILWCSRVQNVTKNVCRAMTLKKGWLHHYLTGKRNFFRGGEKVITDGGDCPNEDWRGSVAIAFSGTLDGTNHLFLEGGLPHSGKFKDTPSTQGVAMQEWAMFLLRGWFQVSKFACAIKL